MTLYKYRSIQEFKNFIDIIINSHLYAAPYFDMNDPMEGQYIYPDGTLSRDIVKAIKGEKQKMRICSLSRTPKNSLMWAHYADGHHGVVIGINVDRNKYDVRPINYVGLSNVQHANINGTSETAKNILCHKYEAWHYEEEERIFVTDDSKFADVNIEKIILGSRMVAQDKNLIRDLVSKIAPEITVENSNIEKII